MKKLLDPVHEGWHSANWLNPHFPERTIQVRHACFSSHERKLSPNSARTSSLLEARGDLLAGRAVDAFRRPRGRDTRLGEEPPIESKSADNQTFAELLERLPSSADKAPDRGGV
jgi:hypothetical protein